MDFITLVQLALATLAGLVGFPSLLTVIIPLLEKIGWLASGNIDKFNFWANAVVFVGVFIASVLGKFELINDIDVTLGSIARWVTQLLILLGIPFSFSSARRQIVQVRQGLLGK